MAHIPFGYCIEGGHAVIHEEQAARFTEFVRLYLGGISIREAAERAGLEVSYGTARKMLQNPVYAGTDYYPAIISQETLEEIRQESARRTTPATTGCAEPLPVESRFVIREPDPQVLSRPSSPERISYLYTLIKPSPRGHKTMSREDIDYFRSLRPQEAEGDAPDITRNAAERR